MRTRLKAPGGVGGWIIELKDYPMSAVFVEKTTPDPADTAELEEALADSPWAAHVDPDKQTPYVELAVNAKTISQLRSQAGWR